MPAVIFTQDLCAGTPVTPTVTGCVGASKVEWTVVSRPAGASLTFSNPGIAEPEITASIDGEYEISVCCFFDEGVVAVEQQEAVPELNCPVGVVAGELATVYLNGCENGVITNAVATGAATSVSFSASGVGSVTTDPAASGPAGVSVDCTVYDDLGMPTVTSFDCEFEVIASDVELVCSVSTPVSFSYETCGQTCECATVIALFDCGETECEEAQIGLVFKDCPPCPDPEDCPELEFEFISGPESLVLNPCSDPLCGDCDEPEYCCDEDQPVFFWNSLFSCPGWIAEAPASFGTTIYNAASCNSGQQYCIEGDATIVLSGPSRFIDSLIIWGHNMTDAVITTSPLSGITDNVFPVRSVTDDSCLEGYTVPVIINFADVPPEGIENLTITITNNTDQPICIDRIFPGQKFFLEDDALPSTFQNPFDGTDYELEYKESDCGTIAQSLRHVEVELGLEFEAGNRWTKERWRAFLRYAQTHGLFFQPSRNNCPGDLFVGRVTGPVGPSSYLAMNCNLLNLQAKGFITQPQTFVPRITA